MKNISSTNDIQSGYDLPVHGLDSNEFFIIHVPALVCIFLSLICVTITLAVSFKAKDFSTFFNWKKSERFIVYLAICDGLFNISHSMDHLHILITRDHPYPRGLCEFYGFMLAEFITAQNLMVNVVSINAFVLMYCHTDINFGRYDYRLLLWTFGLPFIAAMIALGYGEMGPNGTYCYFDSVKGKSARVVFLAIFMVGIFIINSILYLLTWLKIRREEPIFKGQNGESARVARASHRAARTMSLFVIAFFIQWWAKCVYGIWQTSSDDGYVPTGLIRCATTFSNTGGILNGIVFLLVKRRFRENVCEVRNTLGSRNDVSSPKPTVLLSTSVHPIKPGFSRQSLAVTL